MLELTSARVHSEEQLRECCVGAHSTQRELTADAAPGPTETTRNAEGLSVAGGGVAGGGAGGVRYV